MNELMGVKILLPKIFIITLDMIYDQTWVLGE